MDNQEDKQEVPKAKKNPKAPRIREYMINNPDLSLSSIARIFHVEDSYPSKIKRQMEKKANKQLNLQLKPKQKSKHDKRGPRVRVFPCIALKKDGEKHKILYKPIVAKDAMEAKEIFKETFGISASICDVAEKRGYYIAKGTGMDEVQRFSITVPASSFIVSGTNFKGQFKGWNVIASGINACKIGDNQFEKDELVSLVFVSQADPSQKFPKPKLKKLEVIERLKIDSLETIQ